MSALPDAQSPSNRVHYTWWTMLLRSLFSNNFPHTSLWRFWSPNVSPQLCEASSVVSATAEASHSWGETFGDQKRHRVVIGKLLEKDDPARITQKLFSSLLLSREEPLFLAFFFSESSWAWHFCPPFFILLFWLQRHQQPRQVSSRCSCILYNWIH